MKVKFIAKLGNTQIEEIVDIDEEKIKGNGFWSKNILYGKLESWMDSKVERDYEVIDERFPDGEIPYMDEVTRGKLNW